ncbi:glycosyltransferase family 2 protein [Faecalicatena sp. AGMB00832]|uniref:Glycosyltransferase family 2 protein n=1 Tax=Faecalicatena faecalis TaxID=2726362 RepID=A0ABS6CZH7_9FIRM|nr:glycosyltransferase family 2 protein [Faecalicatena faecalis]MBU3874734.1 glycosyltransferase family 2 protein [Faecalicatena faecalis]
MRYRTVDIIIPIYRPDIKFDILISKLLRQNYPIQKIIVVNTKSGSFPYETVGLSKKISVIEISKEEFDHGATRNMAVQMSDAEIVVCMTQDAVPQNYQLIEYLVAPFDDEKVGCTYARQLPAEECDTIERYTRQFNYPAKSCIKDMQSVKEMGIKAYFCSNVCAAYRRTYYDEAGGFIKKAIFNEDMIMAAHMLQLGYKCAYVSEAEVIHSHNYTCTQQLKRNFDIAVSQLENPEVFKGIKSENEGIRLVRSTAVYLVREKKPWLLVQLVVKSGFKYLGFLLGKNYKKLPLKLILLCSLNPKYWTNMDKE